MVTQWVNETFKITFFLIEKLKKRVEYVLKYACNVYNTLKKIFKTSDFWKKEIFLDKLKTKESEESYS